MANLAASTHERCLFGAPSTQRLRARSASARNVSIVVPIALSFLVSIGGSSCASDRDSSHEDEQFSTFPLDDTRPRGFSPSPCRLGIAPGFQAGLNARCGWMTVPAIRGVTDPRSIHLPVARLAPAERDSDTPILVLVGGPGENASPTAGQLTPDVVNALRREVIIFDQRGAGISIPEIPCAEFRSLHSPDDVPELLATCARRLEFEGFDVAAYSLGENVLDIVGLLDALEISQVILLGIGHGTSVALQVAHDHPTRVEALVLDSAVLPTDDAPLELPGALERALASVIATCEEDPSCGSRFPELGAALDRSLSAMLASDLDWPGRVRAPRLTYDEYVDGLIYHLTSSPRPVSDTAVYITELDAAIAAGTIPGRLNDGVRRATTAPIRTSPLHFTTVCEDYRGVSAERFSARLEDARPTLRPFLDARDQALRDACARWPSPRRNRGTIRLGSITAPTLVLASPFDVHAPLEWGEHVAASVARGAILEVEEAAHGVVLSAERGCAVDTVHGFIQTRDPAGTQNRCPKRVQP